MNGLARLLVEMIAIGITGFAYLDKIAVECLIQTIGIGDEIHPQPVCWRGIEIQLDSKLPNRPHRQRIGSTEVSGLDSLATQQGIVLQTECKGMSIPRRSCRIIMGREINSKLCLYRAYGAQETSDHETEFHQHSF